MKSDLIPVNIIIADRSYRLKIAIEDEEIVRKTIKVINDKIIEYKTIFAGKDMQDYVSMVLLWYATEQEKPAIATVNTDVYKADLQKIAVLIDKALKTNEKEDLTP